MYEIDVYGDILPQKSEKINTFSFERLKERLKEANGKDLKINIRSFGGDVQTGFDVFHALKNYAKNHNAKITTFGEGFVASIATIIFLAGDFRILTEHTNPFFHNAWTFTTGDHEILKKVSEDLEITNKKIANHLANYTKLNVEEWLIVMNGEISITPHEALEIGFCTEIEFLK